jgi:hypothetical protein
MSSDKTARDQANNQRFKDIYVHASQEPWIPFFSGIAATEHGDMLIVWHLPPLSSRRGALFRY